MFISRTSYSTIWIAFIGVFIVFLFRVQVWHTKGLENWGWWHLNKGLADGDPDALQVGQSMFSYLGADHCETYEDYCAVLSEKLDTTNHLVNGGFEFNQQAWVINLPQEVSAEFSEDNVYAGNRSLQILFHGQDVNFYHIYQEAEVLPDHCYELTAYIRAESLTGEVGLDVWDAERGYRYWYGGQTQLVGETVDWTPVYLSFCTPVDVFRVQVRLRRFGGRGEDITGIAWFDSIRLHKVEP